MPPVEAAEPYPAVLPGLTTPTCCAAAATRPGVGILTESPIAVKLVNPAAWAAWLMVMPTETAPRLW